MTIVLAATLATLSSFAATAFAKINGDCSSTCSGGGKAETQGEMCTGLPICNGGSGGHTTLNGNEITQSGGGVVNGGTVIGGFGVHSVCDFNTNDCSVDVGGGHVK